MNFGFLSHCEARPFGLEGGSFRWTEERLWRESTVAGERTTTQRNAVNRRRGRGGTTLVGEQCRRRENHDSEKRRQQETRQGRHDFGGRAPSPAKEPRLMRNAPTGEPGRCRGCTTRRESNVAGEKTTTQRNAPTGEPGRCRGCTTRRESNVAGEKTRTRQGLQEIQRSRLGKTHSRTQLLGNE